MEYAKGFQMIGVFFVVGIDVNFLLLPFLLATIFVTRLEITEILSTRLINSNTHQYAAIYIYNCLISDLFR